MAAKKQKKKSSKPDDAKNTGGTICLNRKAKRNYALGERFEAGVVLTGTEVKSCRDGKAHLNHAYVQITKGEAFLVNAHIAEYSHGGLLNHQPDQERKLLMHRREIDKLAVKVHERGATLIPLAMYFKGGRVKVEVAIAKGKAHEDQREDIKKRDVDREIQRALRRGRR